MLPPSLRKGDTIAIAATARKVSLAEMQPAITLFESWGLKVLLPEGFFNADHQFAGNDAHRADNFQQLLDNADVKAIICARGGYGTARIIDKIDFSRFSEYPKWIIGYSDITVLHSHILSHTPVASLHATMPINMQSHNADEQSIESLRHVLFGERVSYSFPFQPLNRDGKAQGRLIGGNMSVLYSLLGTPSDIVTDGCILFLEDLDEYLYHIDRMMLNLKRNGKLAKLAGLVIGGMNDMKDNTVPFGKTAEEIIAEHTAGYDYPVAFGFPAGHEIRNLALPFGTHYTFSTGTSGSILVQS
jgi:muramoyltetrapeptide carboxypeptidase